MQANKHKSKALRTVIIILAAVACVCLSLLIGLMSVSGIMSADPYIYLAAGNSVDGTVISKEREGGLFFLTVSTNKFGDLSVECSLEQYKDFQVNTNVTITSKLCIE